MKTFEELEAHFGESCRRFNHGKNLEIKWCLVGDNFYDYNEEVPETMDFYPEYEYLKEDPRISWRTCEECCGCSGW